MGVAQKANFISQKKNKIPNSRGYFRPWQHSPQHFRGTTSNVCITEPAQKSDPNPHICSLTYRVYETKKPVTHFIDEAEPWTRFGIEYISAVQDPVKGRQKCSICGITLKTDFGAECLAGRNFAGGSLSGRARSLINLARSFKELTA